MSLRARIECWLTDGWMRRGLVYWLFYDVSLLVRFVADRRRKKFLARRLASFKADRPVVVVGNLIAGGTGKTPVTIALIEALRARGRHPGVVMRGYGSRKNATPRIVDERSDPRDIGDEALLIAHRTRAPVAVHIDRAAAVRALCAHRPDIDVVVCDDGLQHYRLERDVEIVVFDARGAGNGRFIPAGPLREALDRPRNATLFIDTAIDAALAIDRPAFSIPLAPAPLYPLASAEPASPDHSRRQPSALRGAAISAYAGIGNPAKFFSTLASLGASVDAHPLPDHHRFEPNSFARARHSTVVITEKDAVKCARLPALRDDARVWVLPVNAILPSALIDLVLEKLDGPQAA